MSNFEQVIFGVGPTGQAIPVAVDTAGNIGSTGGQALTAVGSNVGQVAPSADNPIPANARIRSILLFNGTAANIYLQIHSSSTALTGTSVPFAGFSMEIPPSATLLITQADFGREGRFFAINTRVGVSSTFATFTALTAPNLALCSLNLETT
jgi:hypothetical protein